MTRLDREPRVVRLAEELGLEWSNQPVSKIVDHCLEQIASWLSDGSAARTVRDIEARVCQRLGLTFRDVHSDDELVAISALFARNADRKI